MRPLLVIGSASCVWEDLAQIDPTHYDVGVVNDMGATYTGPIKFWATLHAEKIPDWRKARAAAGGDGNYKFWSYVTSPPHADEVLRPDWGGSSGLFAVRVGLHLGYERILLAGVPMTVTPHFDKPELWTDCQIFLSAWIKRADLLRGKVQSLSGWTKEWFGGPVPA